MSNIITKELIDEMTELMYKKTMGWRKRVDEEPDPKIYQYIYVAWKHISDKRRAIYINGKWQYGSPFVIKKIEFEFWCPYYDDTYPFPKEWNKQN